MELFKHQEGMFEKTSIIPFDINGSEAGTGKTFPAIRFIEGWVLGRTIVIAPAFLCYNWLKEIEKFSSSVNAFIYNGKNFRDWNQVIICSYNRLDSLKDNIKRHKAAFVGIIADEAHYANNISAKRTLALHYLVKYHKPQYLKLLTGTPINNKISGLFSLCALLDYKYKKGFLDLYPSQYKFNMEFMNMVEKRIGYRTIVDFEGHRNLDKLRPWIKPYYYRYTLAEIEDLPELTHSTIICKAYNKELDKKLNEAWKGVKNSEHDHIACIKVSNALLKVPFTLDYVKNCFEIQKEPLIIYTDHLEPLEIMANKLRKKGYRVEEIKGATHMKNRNETVEAFQSGKVDVLIGTIGAMSVGLTLTKASTVVFNDRSWIPSSNVQCEKRIHRIGQEKPCRIVDIVRGGVDFHIRKKLVLKEKTISEVFKNEEKNM